MASKKRTSLHAVLGLQGDPDTPGAPAVADAPLPHSSGRRPGIKQQTAYLPEAVYEQLRKLAFDERRRIHSYLMEGLDRVFRDRGLPSVEELTGKHVG
jgi:hypothetical protein